MVFDIEVSVPFFERRLEAVVGIKYMPGYMSNKTNCNC
jgi:hypothetical protein